MRDPDFSAEPDGRLRSRQLRVGRLPAAGVGLKPPLAQAIVIDHAEAQAAAVLRRPGSPSEATLVLNHTPATIPSDPWSAKRSSPRSCRKEHA